jgi:apolipoprotein N-acyltransferase
MRALETGRPMLRATNTGMTALIDAQGRVVAALPPHEAGLLDVQVQGTEGLTPYVRTGNLGVLVVALAALLGTATTRRRGLGG